MNPLIVSSLLLNKCNRQQFTAKYQKDPSSLFFRSPVPTNQMALQWTVTCFSFGGKCTPGIPVSPSTPTTSNSTLYMHFISVRWIPGRKLLSHPQVKRVKTFLVFLRPSAALREYHTVVLLSWLSEFVHTSMMGDCFCGSSGSGQLSHQH